MEQGMVGYSSRLSVAELGGPRPELAGHETGAGRLELADLMRLARRATRGVVRAARADQHATLAGLLRQHLGTQEAELTVVEESWPAYEHVNVQAR